MPPQQCLEVFAIDRSFAGRRREVVLAPGKEVAQVPKFKDIEQLFFGVRVGEVGTHTQMLFATNPSGNGQPQLVKRGRSRRKRERPVNDISQLTDVPRPMMGNE